MFLIMSSGYLLQVFYLGGVRMKNQKKVSIIVPVYNTSSYVTSCLKSLQEQTYQNIEILVMNDGSTDESEKIIKELQEKDNRIKYFYQENKGVSSARNLGILKATGEYLCFVDSDDMVSTTFVEDFLSILSSEVDLVATSITSLSNQEESVTTPIIKEYEKEKKYDILYDEFSGYLCNKMFRSSIIKEKKLFLAEDISMCEDILFLYQYLIFSKKVVGLSKKNYFYRLNQKTASNDFQNEKWFSIFTSLQRIYDLRDYYPENILKKIIYSLHKALLEGEYRLSYLEENQKEEKKKQLKEVKQLLKEIPTKMERKDSVKIIIFKLFKKTSMKYLKRKVE